jgi:hypothetical protein
MHRRNAYASTHTDNAPEVLDVGGAPERPEHVLDCIPGVALGKQMRCPPDRLKDDGNRALSRIRIGYRQRDSLAEIGVELKNDELAGQALFGNERRVNSHLENFAGELGFFENSIHI